MRTQTINNIHIAARFNFEKLLPETLAFINHGGQNSVIDGLIYGVPQIIYPGKVFGRKYNAQSIVQNGAGIEISYKDFLAKGILQNTQKILYNVEYKKKAQKLGKNY